VTLEKVGVLAGQVANLSGADLSSDRRRLAVDSHTSPDPTNVEGVAFSWGGHDLNLLAENRDVFFVPAGAYER
jgi:hypothetical protein